MTDPVQQAARATMEAADMLAQELTTSALISVTSERVTQYYVMMGRASAISIAAAGLLDDLIALRADYRRRPAASGWVRIGDNYDPITGQDVAGWEPADG